MLLSVKKFSFLALALLRSARAQGSDCDAQCLANTASSWEEKQHASNDFAFYSPPKNFSKNLEPGTLLRIEDATDLANYTVPSSLSMSRILYVTADVNGTSLPTSAYILWPYTPLSSTKGQGHPMVAWAHGTSGVFKPCAPSNYRSLQYHFMVPFLLAEQGMVVVAPDYAGLGVDSLPSGQQFHHPWATSPAQANDLANAITAAREAYPKLLKPKGPFVIVGHSQGGKAAWGFAERQAKKPLPGYQGTVSIAPPTRFIDQLELALANQSEIYSYSTLSLQPKLVDAVTTVYPSYNYSGMSNVTYDRWFNVLKRVQGCLPTDVLSFSTLPLDQIARPGWQKDRIVQQWANLTNVGEKKFKGPLLVLAGETDAAVSFDVVKSTVQETCNMIKEEHWDESLELVSYSSVGHFSIIQASQSKWLAWVKERLTGTPPPQAGCKVAAVAGLRAQETMPSSAPNFLVEWVNPVTKYWQYVL